MTELAPAQAPEPPKATFWSLLEAITKADEAMTVEIDLTSLGELVRDKVDAIKAVDKKLDEQIASLKKTEATFKRARKAVENNKKRLRAYVAKTMVEQGFKVVPGQKYSLSVAENEPKLILDREANATDFLAKPDLVEQERIYRWKKDSLKARLEAGETFDFARLEIGHQIRFNPKKG